MKNLLSFLFVSMAVMYIYLIGYFVCYLIEIASQIVLY